MLAQQQQQMMATMKGKRTKRSRTASPLTVSTSGEDSCRVATSSSTTTTANLDSGAHICNSRPPPLQPPPTTVTTEEDEDMANCLILLAQGASKIQKLKHESDSPASVSAARAPAAGMFVYECKTCNRCFPSFQALGGHRASHRKPKLPVTVLSLTEDHRDYFQSAESAKIKKVEELGLSLQMACNSSNTLSASYDHHHQNESNNNHKSNKVHACAICGAEFSSGQALGGHMRRHRPIATSSGGSPATAAVKSASPPSPPKNLLCLDLNLPADEEEEQQLLSESPKFIFASSEKTLVFANSLVDCRY
ncbi:hypothetical protein V2J09_010620 [Rumex salicifolius]